MKTNNELGRKYIIFIGLYLFAKFILNIFIGGFDFGALIFAIVAFAAMFSGLAYLNYAVAILLAITFASNLPYNLFHLPKTFIYLIEGVIDVGAAALLILQNDIKEHFTNKWSEFLQSIKK